MRFERCSALSLVFMGVALAFASGCGDSKGSTFGGGAGSKAGSASTSGSSTVAGSSSGSGSSTTGISGTTTITTPIMTGSSGAGGSGGTDSDAMNCGAITQGTKQIPSDIFLMQDRSGSMTCPATDDACTGGNNPMMLQSRWDATVAAANMFINSPQANGIGIGLGLFPAAMGNACMGASYATPVVADGRLFIRSQGALYCFGK